MPDTYLDREIISSVTNYSIAAKILAEGVFTGLHKSRLTGFNVEFSEYRQYNPGDDIKHVDWKSFARQDKLYIKVFEEETNLSIIILVDHSRSMKYNSGDFLNKLEYAKYISAVIGYKVILQQDSFGLMTFNNRITNYLKSSSNYTQMKYMDDIFKEIVPESDTDLIEVLNNLVKTDMRRSLLIIVSDFIDNKSDENDIIKAIIKLKSMKNNVRVAHLLDKNELSLDIKKPSRFLDIENNKIKVDVEPEKIKMKYDKLMNSYIETFRHQLTNSGIKYYCMSTGISLIDNLRYFFTH